MILAAEIIKNPKWLEQYQGRYLIVMDQSVTYPKFDNLDQAICIMAEQGWEAVSIATVENNIGIRANMMYALMARKKPEKDTTNKLTEQIFQQTKRFAEVLEKFEQNLGSTTSPNSIAQTKTNEISNGIEQAQLNRIPDNHFCPKCNAPMILRTVIKGENSGKQFYVCSNYPNCKEVLPA